MTAFWGLIVGQGKNSYDDPDCSLAALGRALRTRSSFATNDMNGLNSYASDEEEPRPVDRVDEPTAEEEGDDVELGGDVFGLGNGTKRGPEASGTGAAAVKKVTTVPDVLPSTVRPLLARCRLCWC